MLKRLMTIIKVNQLDRVWQIEKCQSIETPFIKVAQSFSPVKLHSRPQDKEKILRCQIIIIRYHQLAMSWIENNHRHLFWIRHTCRNNTRQQDSPQHHFRSNPPKDCYRPLKIEELKSRKMMMRNQDVVPVRASKGFKHSNHKQLKVIMFHLIWDQLS